MTSGTPFLSTRRLELACELIGTLDSEEIEEKDVVLPWFAILLSLLIGRGSGDGRGEEEKISTAVTTFCCEPGARV